MLVSLFLNPLFSFIAHTVFYWEEYLCIDLFRIYGKRNHYQYTVFVSLLPPPFSFLCNLPKKLRSTHIDISLKSISS